MNALMNESLISALWEQIASEKTNAHIYLEISAFLKNMGLNKMAALFRKQYGEENEHSEMIVDFMTDLNAPVKILEIPSFDCPKTLTDIAKLYLERELQTTDSLKEIMVLASTTDCPVSVEFMRKMISLQQNEYAEATDFYDKMEIIGNDLKFALILDSSME